MSPNSEPLPEESSLPARHRPAMGNLNQDTTESDLWSLDDDLDSPLIAKVVAENPPPQESAAKMRNGEIPPPRQSKVVTKYTSPKPPADEPIPTAHEEERIRINVGLNSNKNKRQSDIVSPVKPEHDFDDLELWDVDDEPGHDPSLNEAREEHPKTAPAKLDEPIVPKPEPAPKTHSNPPPASATPEAEDDYTLVPRPDAVPISLRPHLSLSKIERISIIALLALLILAGASIYLLSIKRLPTETAKLQSNDFPIKGKRLVIQSAISYWRPPITEGSEREIFRRGSQLLPVVELALKGGPASIKVIFRDENHESIGDTITRTVQSDSTLKIAGTAGFDDIGMHAAYRTGDSEPWTVEVLEADPAESDSKKFNTIFEIDISTALR